MHEFDQSPSNPEAERAKALGQIIEQYMPDDTDFIAGMDEDEAVGYVYGMLLEMGEDPDTILKDFGVIEEGESDEV